MAAKPASKTNTIGRLILPLPSGRVTAGYLQRIVAQPSILYILIVASVSVRLAVDLINKSQPRIVAVLI
jgi:hypothetical protein